MISKKTITIPVRIDPDTDVRIKKAARLLKTSSAAIVRLAIASQLSNIESGRIRLPLEPGGAR